MPIPLTEYGYISERPKVIGAINTTYPSGRRHGANTGLVPISFGRAVVADTAEGTVKLPTGAGQIFLGVAVHDDAIVQNPDDEFSSYPINTQVTILDNGSLNVYIEATVVIGDPVYYRHTTGTGTKLGAFGKVADTATCALLANARWITGGLAGETAELHINS